MVGRSLLVLCALASIAHADGGKLAKARAAVDAVRYDQAQALLVDALKEGDHSPAEVAEIYQLSANTAIVLGEREEAERYYRRWLALEPAATLPDSVAPKLREPFVAAQAYMAARGRLSARVSHRGKVVDVVVDADPLAMVAAIAAGDRTVEVGADHHAKLHGDIDEIAVLDEFGNHLLELAVPPAEVEVTRREAPPPPPPQPLSVVRRPIVWLAPAVVLGGVGVGFLLAARDADSQLADVIANSGQHYFGEADTLRARRDRDAIVSEVALAAAGACLVTAVIVYATRPSRVTATAGGVAIRW